MTEGVDGEDGKIRLGLAQMMKRMWKFLAIGDEEVDVSPLVQQLASRHLSEFGNGLSMQMQWD